MKRIFANSVVLFLLLLISSSCSFMEKRTLLGAADKQKDPANMVPKSQYNELLKKYESLLNEKQIKSASTPSTTPDLNQPEILDALNNMKSNAKENELAETVDVFSENSTIVPAPMPVKKELSTVTPKLDIPLNAEEVEKEIEMIRQAQELVTQNKFNEAMENLKRVEKSQVRQVQVNAKFLIGEILFKQQEFDLAMQIFEELISKDAFSGVVIKTLGRLIVCAEKLKLEQKQQRYHSMLHDFFES